MSINVKYPKLLEAIRTSKEEDVKLGILPASRLDACISLDYSKHCTAIKKGIESEALAIWGYNSIGPCPES